MFQLARPLFLTCETPLHAGSGDALGIVDLPIQRERHTSFPKIEASSLKGALREAFEEKIGESNPQLLKAFGPEEKGGDSISAGALGFTDARLILFPVKSMKGVFAWITCPKVLRQFSSDLKLSIKEEITGIVNVADGTALPLGSSTTLAFGGHFVLEEYTFKKNDGAAPQMSSQSLADWLAGNLFDSGSFWHKKAKSDILVLSDNDFKDFVNLSTEVITRTKIDNETGTVQRGALFTEEYLPAESVLYSLVLASPEFVSEKERRNGEKRPEKANGMMDFFTGRMEEHPVVQLGGNATLGKGLLRTKIISPSNTEKNG
jgi:CRISPR-associated protein Cmr4